MKYNIKYSRYEIGSSILGAHRFETGGVCFVVERHSFVILILTVNCDLNM